MGYNPNKHHRRSIRLKGYDYSQEGLYFITICVQNRKCLFGEIDNGEMILNIFGQIAAEEWENSENIRNNLRIHEYIIMPNHIHGIIEILFKKDKNKESDNKEEDNKGRDIREEDLRGRDIKEEDLKGEDIKERDISTGELQFAPTPTAPTPTAPTAPTNKFQSPSQTIGSIIRGFKIATIKKIKDYIENSEQLKKLNESEKSRNPSEIKEIQSLDFKIWQRNYYEIIIRDDRALQNISNYIINNPANWNNDKLK